MTTGARPRQTNIKPCYACNGSGWGTWLNQPFLPIFCPQCGGINIDLGQAVKIIFYELWPNTSTEVISGYKKKKLKQAYTKYQRAVKPITFSFHGRNRIRTATRTGGKYRNPSNSAPTVHHLINQPIEAETFRQIEICLIARACNLKKFSV